MLMFVRNSIRVNGRPSFKKLIFPRDNIIYYLIEYTYMHSETPACLRRVTFYSLAPSTFNLHVNMYMRKTSVINKWERGVLHEHFQTFDIVGRTWKKYKYSIRDLLQGPV